VPGGGNCYGWRGACRGGDCGYANLPVLRVYAVFCCALVVQGWQRGCYGRQQLPADALSPRMVLALMRKIAENTKAPEDFDVLVDLAQ